MSCENKDLSKMTEEEIAKAIRFHTYFATLVTESDPNMEFIEKETERFTQLSNAANRRFGFGFTINVLIEGFLNRQRIK